MIHILNKLVLPQVVQLPSFFFSQSRASERAALPLSTLCHIRLNRGERDFPETSFDSFRWTAVPPLLIFSARTSAAHLTADFRLQRAILFDVVQVCSAHFLQVKTLNKTDTWLNIQESVLQAMLYVIKLYAQYFKIKKIKCWKQINLHHNSSS